MAQRFKAPWGAMVTATTSVAVLTICALVASTWWRGKVVPAALLVIILAINVALCIRGYEVRSGELLIRRLFWNTRWPLDGRVRATARPNAMRGSWRTWGNGGVFGISGHFAGSGLGRYRAFVTDPERSVVLETARGTVVVSPDRPADFVGAIAASASR